MVRRGVVGFVLVLGTLLGSRVVAAEEAPSQEGRLAVLVGGAFGLNGIGDVPDPVGQVHAGAGWRGSQWLVAGLAAYSYTETKPLLAYWSITRHDVELVGLVAFRPMPPSAWTLHGQLGIGAAFNHLYGIDPEPSERALSASVGAGAGWGPAALTFRIVLPDSELCADSSRCFRAPAQLQLLLSLTVDLAPGVR